MHLAAHGDAKTHMRYVMQTTAMRTIPEAALPSHLPAALVESSQAATIHTDELEKAQSFRYARSDSNGRPVASKATALSS